MARTEGTWPTNLSLAEFLKLQHELQVDSMGADPMKLTGDDLANFIRWNAYALEDEIHEATAECGWKPWATSRHVNHPHAMREMVDAWHFFMNMLLAFAGANGLTIDQMAEQFEEYYIFKRMKNADRQVKGYDGVSGKCGNCKRDLFEVDALQITKFGGVTFCSTKCGQEYEF